MVEQGGPEVSPPHHDPKGIYIHTPQARSFSSLGGRSWKPRAKGQGLVFHGVRLSPEVVDRTVQAAGPPTSLPTPTPGAPHPHPRREARCTSLHLRIVRTAEDPLLSTGGKGLDAGSDTGLRPPGSHVGTNRATRSLSDLAEGSSDTFSKTDPGACPSQVPGSEASSPLPEDQPTPDTQGPKGNSHHSPTRQSFLPSCSR